MDFATDSTAHCYAYQFIHPLVTEFLAGFYLRKLPPVNQLTFLFENSFKLFENGFTHWLTFFFGFTSDVFTSSQTAFINRTKLMMNSHIHYLGPEKKSPLESMSMSDRHNAERHNGGTMEVILMLRPLPKRINFVVPSTNEEVNLILSNDISNDMSAHNNSSANADFSEFEERVAVVRCMDEFDATRDNTLPSLQVVPKILTGRAQHTLPKPFVHPAQAPRVDSILPEGLSNTLQEGSQRKSDSIQTPGVANLNDVADFHLLPSVTVVLSTTQSRLESLQYGLMNRHSPAQTGGATSIPPSRGAFVHSFTAKQAVGVAQQSPRRQANLRQGTVLYTSVPDKIPSDRIQPLPNQHTLIRKGGNGSVFSENVNGLALAVKKTSYRSKEYTIITKIRHKNIVPLLAYVWGEKHKKSKRKFYVYHFLPKFSGDMARLVTDKEELSLHDFHQRFHNNPREMGVAVGNVKYILSQVLQGLHYLHDSHRCIHRDVKASNVLIKFFCNCDNPVQCSCDVKYQVSVCVCVCVWFYTFTHIIIYVHVCTCTFLIVVTSNQQYTRNL